MSRAPSSPETYLPMTLDPASHSSTPHGSASQDGAFDQVIPPPRKRAAKSAAGKGKKTEGPVVSSKELDAAMDRLAAVLEEGEKMLAPPQPGDPTYVRSSYVLWARRTCTAIENALAVAKVR